MTGYVLLAPLPQRLRARTRNRRPVSAIDAPQRLRRTHCTTALSKQRTPASPWAIATPFVSGPDDGGELCNISEARGAGAVRFHLQAGTASRAAATSRRMVSRAEAGQTYHLSDQSVEADKIRNDRGHRPGTCVPLPSRGERRQTARTPGADENGLRLESRTRGTLPSLSFCLGEWTHDKSFVAPTPNAGMEQSASASARRA
jgi:hypothetical protein